MREQRRPLASRKQPAKWQLPQHSTTPTMISDTIRASRGPIPTQAKSLSLGEYIFLTDITFMFTHSFQLSVLILFHCNIHASLFSVLSLLLVCLKNLKKNQKNQLQLLASLLSMHVVVVIKRKLNRISHSSFACWELSRVHSCSDPTRMDQVSVLKCHPWIGMLTRSTRGFITEVNHMYKVT